MSKAIKFKNNTYIDSSAIAHNRQSLKNILEAKTIYDSGSNSNGSWLRYNDGTMICYGTRYFTITADYLVGTLYYNQNGVNIGLGNYPLSFVDTPVCILGGGSGSLNYSYHNQQPDNNAYQRYTDLGIAGFLIRLKEQSKLLG